VLEWYSRSMFRGQQLYFLRVALGVLVLAVGYSRVYLQVHTPLQVLAGFLIGGVIGILFQYFVRRLSVK